MSDKVDMDKVYFAETQRIELYKPACKGWILDIGGGGEGVIGQLLGEQVIAIDPIKRELEEAPDVKSLKLVMDAKELKFLDSTFNTATSFFTMMYIADSDKKKVFQEIHRVLRPGGELLLWDAHIPPYDNGSKDMYAVPLEIHIEQKVIQTGYGIKWPAKEQDMDLYADLGETTGLTILEKIENKDTFFIRFKK